MKYKTSEVIEMLEKNPKLEFKCTQGNTGMYDTISVNHGRICWNGDNKYPMYIVVEESREWELIQQPVSFMEAVKAYSEGKTIRCEIGNTSPNEYTPDENSKCGGTYYLIENSWKNGKREFGCITVEEILEGIWYVEDSNE